MTDAEHRRARWEGIVQTAVFIGALLVLVAVLYSSVVVQRGRLEAAQRLETSQAAATVARKSAPPRTGAAYPMPERAPTLSVYPAPAAPAALPNYPAPPLAPPSPTGAAP